MINKTGRSSRSNLIFHLRYKNAQIGAQAVKIRLDRLIVISQSKSSLCYFLFESENEATHVVTAQALCLGVVGGNYWFE